VAKQTNGTIDSFIETIENMSVKELNELVKALEEKPRQVHKRFR